MKLKKAVAVLVSLVLMVTAVVPAFAATSVSADTYITLDDGSRLCAPSGALDGSYMIVKQTGRQLGSLIFEQTQYVIYSFDGWIGSGFGGGTHDITSTYPSITEGEERNFYIYKSGYFYSEFDALDSDAWTYDSYSDSFSVSGDIVYSTFDYYDADGNLIYGGSRNVTDDYEDPALRDFLIISPVMDYSGCFPALSTLSDTYQTNNWAIFRLPDPYTYDTDSNGLPVYDSETCWRYTLYFFSDDYEVTFGYRVFDEGLETEKKAFPYVKIDAATTYAFDLMEDNDDAYYYYTDSVLQSGTASYYWGGLETYHDECTNISYGYMPTEITSDSAKFQTQLSNLFVASSFAAAVDETTWYTDGSDSATSYTIPAFSWSVTLFDLANSTTTEETEESGIIAWLERIYHAMVTGFEKVIDAIGLGGDGSTSVDNVPDTNENINPDSEEDGFSIGDIFGTIWEFVKSILGGLWNFLSSILAGIGDAIGDFFDLISDTTSEIFGVFDNTEPTEESSGGAWYYVGSFFQFMQNLWLCIPDPIKYLVYASFTIMVVFGLLKMFH